MNRAYIALGSNLANPLRQLQQAVKAIGQISANQLVDVSAAYSSSAVGPGEQPDYLNAVLAMDTELSPLTLLDTLQGIENAQGRERNVRWGARTLDLDILLYGEQTIQNERLTLPHPRMAERNFVLYPLLEICGPNLMLPSGAELGTLVAACARDELHRTAFSLRI